MMTIQELAELVLKQTRERLASQYSEEQASWERVEVRPGRKYTKIDRGSGDYLSGMLMIDNATGEIFGIKGYGQVHKGRRYGTLETVDQWYWGDYYPRLRIERATPSTADWYACAVIGTDDETSEVDGYFRGDKPGRQHLNIPAGWKVLEFSVRKAGK